MSKHIALGKARNAMPGYRVQIFFGDNREDANLIKSEFLRIYPNIGAYLVYQQPNFKIRVGDFKTRLLATEFLLEVQDKFPMAFLVKDNIKLPR
ncbi:MAG: SPOR domain-containing protein [Bacteroidia bacterium]